MTERACRNWLESYKDWIYPRSEAPETYILWSGLFALSSVLKRNVWIPQNKLLGSWACYPHMYVWFVGPPATRKTSTMDFADKLLSEIPSVTEAADSMTQQVLAKRIADTRDCSISIRSGELGTFINPSGPVMVDFLCSLWDAKRKFTTDTLMRGVEFAQAPCANMIAATTPVWIANNLSELMVGGGLTSRAIIIYEEDMRRRQLFYESLDYDYFEKVSRNLTSDLLHISSLAGEFSFTDEAKEFAEEWYRNLKMPDDYRLVGYFGRKHVHLFKVAMLLRVAYSDELVITKRDLERALSLLAVIEKKLALAYHSVGKNPYTMEMDTLLDFIQKRKRVTRIELLSTFYPIATPAIILELIGALMSMGKIAIESTTGDYIFTEKKKYPPSDTTVQ